ncbi:hypothetical protein TSOC_011470, partial [Tetrabaena socialis]
MQGHLLNRRPLLETATSKPRVCQGGMLRPSVQRIRRSATANAVGFDRPSSVSRSSSRTRSSSRLGNAFGDLGSRFMNPDSVRGSEDSDDVATQASHARGVVAASGLNRQKRRWTAGALAESATLLAEAALSHTPHPAGPPNTPSNNPYTAGAMARSVTRVRHAPQPPKPKPASSSTTLSDSVLLRYERDGFVVTRRLLAMEGVTALRASCEYESQARRLESLRHRVRVLCPGVDAAGLTSEAEARAALKRHATDELGFLQVFNLHRSNAGVGRDCLFLKEPGFAETNWHSDLRMAPFDTNDFVTAWIPLRPIRGARAGGGEEGKGGSSPDSGLIFAAGSHRDFALPFWHEMEGMDLSTRNYAIKDTGPMEVGDVSWHHGWTLHCAAQQPLGTPPRLAL